MTRKANIRTHYEELLQEKDKKIEELEKALDIAVSNLIDLKYCTNIGPNCSTKCRECIMNDLLQEASDEIKENNG